MNVAQKGIAGFTLVETVAVIMLLGILSAVAFSSLGNVGESEYAERILLKANLRYARQRALDSTNQWGVAISAGSYRLTPSGEFPATESNSRSPGVSLSGPNITFEAQTGASTSGSIQTITIGGNTIRVHPTGYIQ